MYGDPVYKQNLADIKDRDRRIQRGTLFSDDDDEGLNSLFTKYFEENDRSSIPSYYVDKDRNIPISDFNDIKGNLTSRYCYTNPYIYFVKCGVFVKAIPEEK